MQTAIFLLPTASRSDLITVVTWKILHETPSHVTDWFDRTIGIDFGVSIFRLKPWGYNYKSKKSKQLQMLCSSVTLQFCYYFPILFLWKLFICDSNEVFWKPLKELQAPCTFVTTWGYLTAYRLSPHIWFKVTLLGEIEIITYNSLPG